MKVKINYTSKECEIISNPPIFQHSHNTDYIEVLLDQYEPGLVYKLNIADASGVKNLSRHMNYIGFSDDQYYFRVYLNSTNTKYYGDITMSVSIFTQETDGETTTTTKIWNSESFTKYINESEEDETVDIDSEETTIIDEIYSNINLKLNETHKGYYLADTDLGLTIGEKTTQEFVNQVIDALTDPTGDFLFEGVALIEPGAIMLTDLADELPFGGEFAIMTYASRPAGLSVSAHGYLIGTGSIAEKDKMYYCNYTQNASTGAVTIQGWKKLLNTDDLTDLIDGTVTVKKAEQDEDGNNIKATYETKSNAITERAKKANLQGGNYFKGNQNFSGGDIDLYGDLRLYGLLDFNGGRIVDLANPTDPYHAANKRYVDDEIDADISTHDTSEASHLFLRQIIEDLEQEIERIDNRGRSYGEVPYTTAELQALNAPNLYSHIAQAIQANSWFEGMYIPSNGDLVFDTGIGDGVNYHEWEFNGTAWVDNGAINTAKASNTIFGKVKGNSYVSIVSGLMQILLADNATYLKDAGSANKYTYQQIYDAISNRYTKIEVDALLDSFKAIYGWESSDLTPTALENTDTLALSAVADYDELLFLCRNTSTNEIDTQKVPVSELTNGTDIEFFGNSAIVVNIDATNITFNDVGATETLKIYGVKMDKSQFNEIRNIEEQNITYNNDGQVSQITGDNVTTTPLYDEQGNIIKLTEVYALDGKTYETTFVRDALGRIINSNKQEVI